MILAIDFDGTIVEHGAKFPEMGPPIPHAIETLKQWVEDGDQLILYTMRTGDALDAAVAYLEGAGVKLWGINDNPGQKHWAPESRKVYSQLLVDDTAVGCPLVQPSGTDRPYVDWMGVRALVDHVKAGKR